MYPHVVDYVGRRGRRGVFEHVALVLGVVVDLSAERVVERHEETEILVGEVRAQTAGIGRQCVADDHAVALVDHAVARTFGLLPVDVAAAEGLAVGQFLLHIAAVVNLSVERVVAERAVFEDRRELLPRVGREGVRFVVGEDVVLLVAVEIADRTALGNPPEVVFQIGFALGEFLDGVPVARDVERGVPAEILRADEVAGDRELETAVADLADVRAHGRESGLLRELAVGQQAVGVFVIVVGRDGQAAVEEAQVETHVHLAGLLPAQVVHGEACGIDAAHAVVDVTRGVGIEVVVVADLLVAGDTPADADLGVVERATREIHEIFVREAPGGRYRGEVAPAVFFREARRTVAAEGRLDQVFRFEVVGHAGEKRCHRVIRLPGAGVAQGEVGGEGVHRGDEVRRGVDTRQDGLVGAPLLLAETHEGREVVVAPLVLIGKDVLVEPVPVEVVGGVTAVALLPLVGDHARVDALALVEVEIGIDAGLERQPLGELQFEALVEIALIVLRAVGRVFHLCQRALLALEYAGQRAVGIVEVEIGTA